jgi:translocon-associated protein subunit alpha
LILSSCFIAYAQEEEENEDTVTETANNDTLAEVVLTAAPGVTTSFIFPDYPTKQIAVGRNIDVVIGFANEGSSSFNVTQIFAALRYPLDWRYYIQNFSRQAEHVLVKPGEHHTFHYTFMPDADLETRDLGFSGQFFYSDLEGNNYTSYFYNTTISLVEVAEPLDLQTVFVYLGMVAVAGLILVVIYSRVSDKKTKKVTRRVETGTVSATTVDPDWLEGTHAAIGTKAQKSPSPKANRKAKAN